MALTPERRKENLGVDGSGISGAVAMGVEEDKGGVCITGLSEGDSSLTKRSGFRKVVETVDCGEFPSNECTTVLKEL